MPALLKIRRSIDNDIWKLTFTLDIGSLSESDKELMRKFGEPQINIGGTLLAGTPNELTIPDKYIRVRSGLPFTQEFDAKSLSLPTEVDNKEAAAAQALAFQETFVAAYEDAFAALRANADSFTGEYIVNI
jgi:hypothetical protein